jgi:hypothetical protein
MIWVKKYKEIEVRKPISFGYGVRGEYRAVLEDELGNVKLDTGWKPNLITDYGLSYIRYGFGQNLYFGTDATAPSVGDTTLYGFINERHILSSETPNVDPTPASPTYILEDTNVAVIGQGEAVGTLREYGIGPTPANQDFVVRGLFTPELTKGTDDQLTFYHRVYTYPQITDSTGIIDISGTSYNYTARAANITSWYGRGFHSWYVGSQYAFNNQAYLGTLGTLESEPSSSLGIAGRATITVSASAGGDAVSGYWHQTGVQWGINAANDATLRSFKFHPSGGIGSMQAEISKVSDGTGLYKENTHELTLYVRMYTYRYP